MATGGLRDILEKHRTESHSQSDRGTRFERIMLAYLLTDPVWAAQIEAAWLWEDFRARGQLGGGDAGIDIVAKSRQGEYWAVQCKCYSAEARISMADLDTFLATSGRTFRDGEGALHGFSRRIFVSTTNLWGRNAEETLRGQTIPVTKITLADLEAAPVDWAKLEAGTHGKAARAAAYAPRPHQQEAIEKTAEYFRRKDRGKLIMACGTGKTFTALKIAETMQARRVLVLAPSIALISQILREWTANAEGGIGAACVCSDPRVSRRQSENDEGGIRTEDLAAPATTDPARILAIDAALAGADMRVVFSTYQSIDAVRDAQAGGLPDFDLVVCDEAHRTTGATEKGAQASNFTKVHDGGCIRAAKRLYMTATPRIYKSAAKEKAAEKDALLCSMDDAEVYGEEIHRLDFGEAVRRNLLCDYKVIVYNVYEDRLADTFLQALLERKPEELEISDAAKMVGGMNALSKVIYGDDTLVKSDPNPMRRAVAFCGTVEKSRLITDYYNDEIGRHFDSLPPEERGQRVKVQSRHIDGGMNATRRDELLDWLKQDGGEDEPSCKMLTNVRCLSEGVDVPSLDAILFLSARKSEIDIVQSVGRVMRLDPSGKKKYGYIILPIATPSDIEPHIALEDNARYNEVWSVLKGLRAHDKRLDAIINSIELNRRKTARGPGGVGGKDTGGPGDGGGGTIIVAGDQMQMDLATFKTLQGAIYARMVLKVGKKRYWEQWAGSVADVAARQTSRLTDISNEPQYAALFDSFTKELQTSVSARITKQDAIEALSQHIITAPMFDALFEGYEFAQRNAVSVAMNKVIAKIGKTEESRELDAFYKYIAENAAGITTAEGKQTIIKELYNNFFREAFPKMAEQLGIVYTPVEIIDFIIRSVDDVLQAEFGRGLTDENVSIIEPFAGTGAFVARLLQSGLIKPEDLERKYRHEIHANEIVLLAYYIACVNIENVYHGMAEGLGENEYVPFEGAIYTDTFQAWCDRDKDRSLKNFSVEEQPPMYQNSLRIQRQNEAPITVIIGNPPYSVGQKSANDDAQNAKYEQLDERIRETYVANSNATNNNSLYDSYMRAFRYASDRLEDGDGDGVICFVSNGAWLDGNATAWFRKSIENEFDKIYVFNLRGNQRTSGEQSRREGGKIFGSGSRAPIAITLLVKRKEGAADEV